MPWFKRGCLDNFWLESISGKKRGRVEGWKKRGRCQGDSSTLVIIRNNKTKYPNHMASNIEII